MATPSHRWQHKRSEDQLTCKGVWVPVAGHASHQQVGTNYLPPTYDGPRMHFARAVFKILRALTWYYMDLGYLDLVM